MLRLIKLRFLPALLLMGILSGPAVASAQSVGDDAKSFITAMADTAVASLTAQEISREERVDRFRSMIDKYFAIKTIGRWVLGSYWDDASREQKKRYFDLFENMLVERYVDAFKNYSGESLEITDADVRSEKDIIVLTQLSRPGATKPVDVGWRLASRTRGDKRIFKVVDILVNGISMSRTQSQEFEAVIRNNGDSVEALLKKMKEMAVPQMPNSNGNG